MPDEYRLLELQRFDNFQHVVTKAICRIIRRGWQRFARCAETAPGDSIHMKRFRQLNGEFVENMRSIAKPSEQNQRTSPAAPVEHFKLDSAIDGDETAGMRSLINGPGANARREQQIEWSRLTLRPDSPHGASVGVDFTDIGCP